MRKILTNNQGRMIMWLGLSLMLFACGPKNTGEFADYEMVNAKRIEANLITAGQPSKSDLEKLAKKGTKLIVSLRGKDELKTFDEKAYVESLGMRFVSIPIESAKDMNQANALKLDKLLSGTNDPVVLHCGSSNRVGGLLAIHANKIKGLPVEDALTYGKKAGMTGTEKVVKKYLSK